MRTAISISIFSFICFLFLSKFFGFNELGIIFLASVIIGCTASIIETIKTHCPVKSDKDINE